MVNFRKERANRANLSVPWPQGQQVLAPASLRCHDADLLLSLFKRRCLRVGTGHLGKGYTRIQRNAPMYLLYLPVELLEPSGKNCRTDCSSAAYLALLLAK